MEIAKRIIKTRKKYGLTQTEFAERLNTTRAKIATYELNRVNFDSAFLDYICKVFNISAEWLITGEGDMCVDSQDVYFDKLAEQYGLGQYARKVLDFYNSLEDNQKDKLESFIREVAGLVMEESINKAIAGINDIISGVHAPDTVKKDLTGQAALVFHDAFPYTGIGNVDRGGDAETSPTAPVDKLLGLKPVVSDTVRTWSAASTMDGKKGYTTPGLTEMSRADLDKLKDAPPVTEI
jgi:transcriptional regulator with XRE-family HTH domain